MYKIVEYLGDLYAIQAEREHVYWCWRVRMDFGRDRRFNNTQSVPKDEVNFVGEVGEIFKGRG